MSVGPLFDRGEVVSKRKSGKFNRDGIDSLANDKSVVYKILNARGENINTGLASRYRVGDRMKYHLRGGKDSIPGAKRVVIDQKPSIAEARLSEARIIKRSQPRHNKQGK